MAETSEMESGTPLLQPRQGSGGDVGPSQTPLSVLLGRVMGRTGPSMLVRETAARELEERRADWGYSKPVVALDMMWNLTFVVVSSIMLICTADEHPNVPIRVWICVYALQCLVHVVLVWIEYSRRNSRTSRTDHEAHMASHSNGNESEEELGGVLGMSTHPSWTKRCESANTMVSFFWWIVGFYWIITGGEVLLRSAPHLYWLAVVFLAFDVFFAILCVVLACLIGIAICCCLPCIIALLYAVAGQEGASNADLSILPRYRFEACSSDGEKPKIGAGRMIPIEPGSGYLLNDRILLPEDAECCICLSQYEDGTELHALPCSHHFHTPCIFKWLKMNATCPLCKYNILKGGSEQQV